MKKKEKKKKRWRRTRGGASAEDPCSIKTAAAALKTLDPPPQSL